MSDYSQEFEDILNTYINGNKRAAVEAIKSYGKYEFAVQLRVMVEEDSIPAQLGFRVLTSYMVMGD